MRDFVRKFVREPDGSWLCVEAAELPLPTGRIQVTIGTRLVTGRPFMGVDLAHLLESESRGYLSD
jgi:hypothetical protein